MIVKNPPDTPGLASVRQVEIPVAPVLEGRIIAGIVPVTGGAQGGMEIRRVFPRLRRFRPHRRQVAATAEPAARCQQHACVHVRCRHVWAPQMRDQADPAGPEARVLLGAGNLGAEFRCKFAPDGGHVDADLFEHPAAHDARHAPATGGAIRRGPVPGRADEAPLVGRCRPRPVRSPRSRRTAGHAAIRTRPGRVASAPRVAEDHVPAYCLRLVHGRIAG